MTSTAGHSAKIIRVIDFETTGVPEDAAPEVVEMAKIDVMIGSKKIDAGSAWQSFACPRQQIPPAARAVHHITDDEVRHAPQARDLWDTLASGLSGDDVFAAHNADFEKFFYNGNGRQWIDTYKVARVVWPDAPGYSNQVLRYWIGAHLDASAASPPHRALPDAYVTAHILTRLMDHKTVPEMIRISEFPALHHRMTFGIHKGAHYSEIPVGYLEWMRDNSTMGEDIKFSARYWLKKRSLS